MSLFSHDSEDITFELQLQTLLKLDILLSKVKPTSVTTFNTYFVPYTADQFHCQESSRHELAFMNSFLVYVTGMKCAFSQCPILILRVVSRIYFEGKDYQQQTLSGQVG